MRDLIKRGMVGAGVRVPGTLVSAAFGDFCPIFMLHRIAREDSGHGHSVSLIERCLTLMNRHGFVPVSLAELARRLVAGEHIPPKSVVFTIDDGFDDHFEIAGELFARHEVPLTCFVISGFLDGELWPWDDQIVHVLTNRRRAPLRVGLPDGTDIEIPAQASTAQAAAELRVRLKAGSQAGLYGWLPQLYAAAEVDVPREPPAGFRPMSWDDARAFMRLGHEIAPHTHTHRILSQLDDTSSRQEIETSISRVRSMTGAPCEIFAYPTGRPGDFGAREAAFLRDAGIRCAVSTAPGAVLPDGDRYAMPRFSFPDTIEDFLQYMSFVELAKDRVRALRRSRA